MTVICYRNWSEDLLVVRLLSLSAALSLQAACSSNVEASDQSPTKIAVGEEVQFCENCPTFVRAPDAPDSLRPIRYVSKYELTWNDFFASYDDGACELPKVRRWGKDPQPITPEHPAFKELRLNWAITKVSALDIECYQEWFEEKTGMRPLLPTYREWEWFARSGVPDRKYPWGNEPDGTKEALDTSLIREELVQAQDRIDLPRSARSLVIGAEVGLFPPTEWGLHDVLGNASELTADIVSAAEIPRYNEELGASIKPRASGSLRLAKGFRLSSGTDYWKRGIEDTQFLDWKPSSFSASVAVRFVIVEGS